MRTIKYLVLHCTATSQRTTVMSIQRYWRNFLRWKNPGYHFIIKADGTIIELLPIDKIANGVRGFNSESIHISYIGGVDKYQRPVDNRTSYQIGSTKFLLQKLTKQFPRAEIIGHRDFPGVNKACPCFDAKKWWQSYLNNKTS